MSTILDGKKTKYYSTEQHDNPVDNDGPEKKADVREDEANIIPVSHPLMSKSEILLLNLSWFGLSVMFLLLTVEVIPAQIKSLVGEVAKGRWLGGMVAAGAVLTFFVSPIIGMSSDRVTLSVGRRRPAMVVGTVSMCIGLIGMAFSAPRIMLIENVDDVMNISAGMCVKDLVKQRCRAFWNQSEESPSHVLPDKKLTSLLTSQTEPEDDSPPGNLALYIVFSLLVTTSFTAVTVPYNALIADKSHPSQRGFNSGVMGAMILMGNVSGAAVGLAFTKVGVLGTYGCAMGIVLLSVAITVFTTTEKPGKQINEPLNCFLLFCGFWEPLKEHDFRWVFLTRFLMQQGVATVISFLEYWLGDMVYLPNCWSPATSVAVMLLPLLFTAAISSIVFGLVSDRTGRRKPIVIGAALIMSFGIFCLIFISGRVAYYLAIAVAFFFGSGFGSFQSVDFALLMDVLPAENDKAKDIAVWHLALILPNALATPIGGLILDFFEGVNCEIGLGYIILFAVTAFYFLLSAIFVLKIRRTR